MNAFIKHIVFPAVAPVVVVGLYFTPVEVFGCANRGLMAMAVVLISALAAFVTAGIGIRARARNRDSSNWWILSTLILVMPLVLVLGPLG
jgi:uncharacterized membrane protein YhaH (DUF805 family)